MVIENPNFRQLDMTLHFNNTDYCQTSTEYRFIDLFAGIGGIRQGFESVFKNKSSFVFASEIDKFAQTTYAANYGHLPFGDITKILPEEIPSFDILLAGFPCQPFSNAGLKKGFNDTRGTLFFDIARITEHHRPKVVFLENVKGFKNHDKGNTFKVVKETLENLGYKVYAKVLNAKDFGVPQNRERIYIIGFLDHSIEFKFPKPLDKPVKLGDILEKKVDDKYTISDKLWAGHQRRKKEHKAKGNGFGYCIFNKNSEYTSTISARYYKDGSEILIEQKDNNPRKLSPREAARLQGFPNNFKIVVSDTQAYKQFGNSVAVPVIKAIAQNIFEGLHT
jgi:DNA (cytosine-5)-methyltransferase 1